MTQTPQISAEATARREQARDEDGKFGPSAAPESDPANVDLAGSAPTSSVGDHHDAEVSDLADVEASLAAQLSRVRTARMQHEIAAWLHDAETSGSINHDAKTLVLLRHDDNAYGSSDLTPGWIPVEGELALDDGSSFPDLTIELHSDSSGPDLYADGWVDDDDRLDLDKVREWSTSQASHGNAMQYRFDSRSALRRDSELALAHEVRDQVREHYPSARYVHLEPTGGADLRLSTISDADGNTLHEMYGEAGEGVPETFDDDVDGNVRGMTADAIGSPPGSWPELCPDRLEFDDYGNVESDVRLDLDLVERRTVQKP